MEPAVDWTGLDTARALSIDGASVLALPPPPPSSSSAALFSRFYVVNVALAQLRQAV